MTVAVSWLVVEYPGVGSSAGLGPVRGVGPGVHVERHGITTLDGGFAVLTTTQIAGLRFDDRGLIPAVVQQHDTGEVLMMAWMDAAAIGRTLEVGEAVFYSRSRQEQWHKGATSGNTQRLVELRMDCDGDVLLVLVDQQGAGVACHTGQRSCFHRRVPGGPDAPPAAAAPPLAP